MSQVTALRALIDLPANFEIAFAQFDCSDLLLTAISVDFLAEHAPKSLLVRSSSNGCLHLESVETVYFLD